MNIFSKKLTALLAVLAITAMSLPMSVGAMATKGNNLITNNAGFESNSLDGWTKSHEELEVAVTSDDHHDGSYSAIISNRADNNDSLRMNVAVEPNTDYYISAWIKPVEAGKAGRGRLKLVVGNNHLLSDAYDFAADQWTHVFGVVNTGNTTETTGYISVNTTTNSTTANNSYLGNVNFYVDDFEICKVTGIADAQNIAGNMITNPGFESAEDNEDKVGWRNASGNSAYARVNSTFDANTGSYAAKVTGRGNNYTGPQQYVTVEPDTYYYVSAMVRLASEYTSVVKARMRLDATDNTNEKTYDAINTSEYTKIQNVLYNASDKEARVYVNTNESGSPFAELWTDDYVLLPITLKEEGATDVVPNTSITLNAPEDVPVNVDTLIINNGAKIESVIRSDRDCVIELSGMVTGVTYTLSLNTGFNGSCVPEWSFTTKVDSSNILDVNGYDPSFETITATSNTTLWNFSGGTSVNAIDTTKHHSGAQSIKVTNRDQTYQGPQAQNVPLTNGERYTASAWVYTEAEGEKATVRLEGADGGSGVYEDLVPGKWTLITRTINVSAATAKVYVLTEGKSDIWVDDLAVCKYTPYKHIFSKEGTSITCEFANNVNSNNLMLAIAAYDSTGKLVYVDADVSTTTSGTLTVNAPTGTYTDAKVFLWDVKTFTPIVGAFSPDSI